MKPTPSPLVTISIPTYNSEATLERCLAAVHGQTYPHIEVNIVDGGSKDRTEAIASQFQLPVHHDQLGLLNARKIGVEQAKGEYVLLLDSDQILEPNAVERAVAAAEQRQLDMLVLEEDVYQARTLLEKLFQLDRKLIHAVKDFSPFTGVMLPRFYKRPVLMQAFANIPQSALQAGGQDHAIIYYEAWQLTHQVDLLPQAVRHIEPRYIREIVPKFYRWGYTSLDARDARYKTMLQRKEAFRKGMFQRGYWMASAGSILLLVIKGVPYQLGRTMASTRAARRAK